MVGLAVRRAPGAAVVSDQKLSIGFQIKKPVQKNIENSCTTIFQYLVKRFIKKSHIAEDLIRL